MDALFAAPRRRIITRKYFALPLMAAVLFAFTGLVPANAAGSTTGRADVEFNVNGNPVPAFAGRQLLIGGEVIRAVPGPLRPTGTVTLLPDYGNGALALAVIDTEETPGAFEMLAPPQTVGTHYFRAAYSGDSNFAPKTVRFPVVVSNGPATTTTVTATPSGTSTLGQMVSFDAQISTPAGPLTGQVLGEVVFYVDGAPFLTAPVLTGWVAGFTTTALSLGKHMITAEYQDQFPWYRGSVSPPVTHTVVSAPAEVKTEIHSSHHGDIPLGQAVTVQAVIAPRTAGKATPTGWVQFYDWNTKVGAPVQLVNGLASFKYTGLKLGKHILNAKYLGSGTYAPRDTPARTVTVVR